MYGWELVQSYHDVVSQVRSYHDVVSQQVLGLMFLLRELGTFFVTRTDDSKTQVTSFCQKKGPKSLKFFQLGSFSAYNAYVRVGKKNTSLKYYKKILHPNDIAPSIVPPLSHRPMRLLRVPPPIAPLAFSITARAALRVSYSQRAALRV